jgi:hypothetical protein
VLHAGGLLADAALPSQTAASLRAVAAPKLSGLSNLSAAAAGQPLARTLLYSSISGELGTAGQANYAAANAALDAAAAAMQARGHVGKSVQLGAWAGAGMAAAQPQLLARLAHQGYLAIQPTAGLAALQTMLGGGSSSTGAVQVAAPFDWRRFLASGSRASLPYFATMAEQAATVSNSASNQRAVVDHQHHAILPAQQLVTAGDVLAALPGILAELAGESLAVPAADVPFLEGGLDSIGAVELR